MTEAEIKKLIAASEERQDAKLEAHAAIIGAPESAYKTLEDIPTWGRAAVQRRLDNGALEGTGGGVLDISYTLLRVWVAADREAGLEV